MDLSPYFLSLAEYVERHEHDAREAVPSAIASSSPSASSPPSAPKRQRIKYVHGMAEASGLAARSVDMLAFNFVIHECPQKTIEDFVAEGRRVLKSGGVLTFVDNNPR